MGGLDQEMAPRIDRFRDEFLRASPFREDRQLAAELGLEAAPVLEALAPLMGAPLDLTEPTCHEALAMLTLLGRRAGRLGATPTAVLGLVPALLSATGARPADQPTAQLQALVLEGYVAGREEGLVEEAARRAQEASPLLVLIPGCVGLFLSGQHEPEAVAEIVDRFGTMLLRTDARAAIVDVTGLIGPRPELAAEVFGADAAARMLGTRCYFAGGEPWLEPLKLTSLPTEVIRVVPDFQTAFRLALADLDLALRPASRLPAALRALLRPRGRR